MPLCAAVLRRLAVLLLPLVVLAGAAAAQTFPALTGRVVDAAGILPPDTEAALDALLAAHETKTTNQVVVATVPSLEGRPIEDYGVALGRHWGIGRKGADNGVILLVAPEERAVRIEVGYGLEGTLTDAIAKLIIEASILPRFRAGDMAGGIKRGAEDIVAVLEGDAAAFKERAAERLRSDETFGDAAATFLFIAFMVLWIVLTNTGRRRRRGMLFPPLGGGWSSRGGGFSGGGGSFGGGGASGRW